MPETVMVWSVEQEAIFEWFRSGSGNLVVEALAGSGKTTTIIEASKLAPEPTILLCAFNKRIAEELQRRIGDRLNIEAKTLHSLGYQLIRQQCPEVTVDGRLRLKMIRDEVYPPDLHWSIQRLIDNLHTKARELMPEVSKPNDLIEIAINFQLTPERWMEATGWKLWKIAATAFEAIEEAEKIEDLSAIDYADMLFLPLRHQWTSPTYDLVVVDECLPFGTPILLADGTSRTIGELVESRTSAVVQTFDVKTKQPTEKRIVGWHKIPNRKPLVKVSVRRPASNNQGRNFVCCTADHKVWTSNRGWVTAGQLIPGDQVQVETAAEKSQQYKITYKGRRRLASLRRADDQTKRRRGTSGRISVRGGNGQGLTKAQEALKEALGNGWTAEYVINTAGARAKGAPKHYKIDLAHPTCQIAVEVDGSSHQTEERRAQDRRKDRWLRRQGWRVFRFSNREAWQRPDQCAATVLLTAGGNCPVPATVVAVDAVEIRDDYVYDISVEDTHCFYANGILVHNCQDMSEPQLQLALGLSKGRIVLVGDRFQAIYSFRGADSSGMDRLKKVLSAQTLGLQTTYRCGTKIVEEAQKIVPNITAREDAHLGEVAEIRYSELKDLAGPGDFVLSRSNAPLVPLALYFLREGKRCRVQGKDIGKNLTMLVEKIARSVKAQTVTEMLVGVSKWESREIERAKEADKSHLIESIQDKAETIRALSEDLETLEDLKQRLEFLFDDGGEQQIICSTVHKAKGLEADTVFVLAETLKRRVMTPEEDNIKYVAITRAKERLVWVHGN